MILRYIVLTFITICTLLQIRNFNRYRVEHRRQFKEAQTYLNSDVCVDAQTRAELGTFNLCGRAEHILDENPASAAFYDILNDWYPCGHGRCEGMLDWLSVNIHWFVMIVVVIGMMIYFKWVEHQRDILYTKMRLPTMLGNIPRKVEHVD
jgi:hypothetical protein